MADPTLPLTHYWPWDGDEQRAVCGTAMRDQASLHSLQPTCPICAAAVAADDDRIDAAVEWTLLPLDAAEADALTPVGAELFALGVSLNRAYAANLRRATTTAFGSPVVQLRLKGVRR